MPKIMRSGYERCLQGALRDGSHIKSNFDAYVFLRSCAAMCPVSHLITGCSTAIMQSVLMFGTGPLDIM